MSDWIRTKIGMQAMENIIRYLPRMTVALEEIAEEQKVKKAESKVRNYIQKKYGKIDLGFVSEGVSEEWLRRWNERTRKGWISKKRY